MLRTWVQKLISSCSISIGNTRSRRAFMWTKPRVETLEDRTLLSYYFRTPLVETGTVFGETGANVAFEVGDWNRDGAMDLFTIIRGPTGSGTTEVHIIDGSTNFQTFALQTATALGPTGTNVDFRVADWDHDGNLDIFAITRSTAPGVPTTVQILNGATNYQTFLLGTTNLPAITGSSFTYDVGDWNLDNRQDLVCVAKSGTASGHTEVHILSGTSNFQSFLIETTTILGQTDDRWDFRVLRSRTGALQTQPGIITGFAGILKRGTGTRSTEVHMLNVDRSSPFQQFVLQTPTNLHETGDNFEFGFFDWNHDLNNDFVVIKKSGTGTGRTEVHIYDRNEAGIFWTNRGQEDSDHFGAVFGAQADAARQVVAQAIFNWERVASNFAQPGGEDSISITVSMRPGDAGNGASASIIDTDPSSGYPKTGSIEIDGGLPGSWYIDPAAQDSLEFNPISEFVGRAPIGTAASGRGDLLTVVELELTHILGITSDSRTRFQLGNFLTDTHIPDNAEGGGIGTYWVFQGSTTSHLMTSNNGGGGGQDFHAAVHTAGPGDLAFPLTIGGQTFSGANDIGNAVYEFGVRYLVSDAVAAILHDAYGYTIASPRRWDTFFSQFVTLDPATGELRIVGGAGASNDIMTITRNAGTINVMMTIGGITLPAVSYSAPSVTSITVSGGGRHRSSQCGFRRQSHSGGGNNLRWRRRYRRFPCN